MPTQKSIAPTNFDLNTLTLLINMIEGFKTEPNIKIQQASRTILGLLRSIQNERLKEKVLE